MEVFYNYHYFSASLTSPRTQNHPHLDQNLEKTVLTGDTKLKPAMDGFESLRPHLPTHWQVLLYPFPFINLDTKRRTTPWQGWVIWVLLILFILHKNNVCMRKIYMTTIKVEEKDSLEKSNKFLSSDKALVPQSKRVKISWIFKKKASMLSYNIQTICYI